MDVKSEVSKLMQEHERQIDELHTKLAAADGADKERLEAAVTKLKAAHEEFEDDAQEFVVH